jgi:hypothetical protein
MGDEKLRRRIPVLRKMGFMRYHGSKDLAPARNITFNRCWHGKLMALRKRTIRHRIESASCTHTMCPYPSRSCRQPCAAICRSRSGQYRLALGVVLVAVVMPLPGESPRECGGSGSRSRRWTDHVWSAEVSAPAFPSFPRGTGAGGGSLVQRVRVGRRYPAHPATASFPGSWTPSRDVLSLLGRALGFLDPAGVAYHCQCRSRCAERPKDLPGIIDEVVQTSGNAVAGDDCSRIRSLPRDPLRSRRQIAVDDVRVAGHDPVDTRSVGIVDSACGVPGHRHACRGGRQKRRADCRTLQCTSSKRRHVQCPNAILCRRSNTQATPR